MEWLETFHATAFAAAEMAIQPLAAQGVERSGQRPDSFIAEFLTLAHHHDLINLMR